MALKKQIAAGLFLALTSTLASATVQLYGQCGGIGWTGETNCGSGATCVHWNDWYYQCMPATTTTTSTKTTTTTTKSSTTTTKSSTTTTKSSTTTTKSSTTTTTTKSTTTSPSTTTTTTKSTTTTPSTTTTTTTTTPSTTTTTTTTTSSTTSASASPTVIPLRGLNTLAKAHGRYFGTSLDGLWSNTDTAYQALSGNFSEFGMVTPGNAMKWDTIEATQNVFSYSHGDFILDWAHNHTQTVRGHVFVWHSQLPSWLTSGTWDNSTLISILQNHIANVGGHYAGKLYAWDVVNEIFNEDGTWRLSLWYNTIGSAFVPIAFNAAHAADSKAKLYMNDYNVEGTGSKSDAYYALAQTLLAQGVPVHGMGAQAHLIVGSLPGNLASNMARFVALGLEFAYTELDIRMTLPATDALLATQASNYASIATASWVPSTFSGQGAALLFDANKQPKPAYKAVADVLAAATVNGNFNGWYTPGSTTTTTTTTATPTSTTTTTTTVSTTTTTATSSATPIALRGLNTLAKAKGRYFGTALDGLWSNTDTVYQALSGNFSEFGMVTPGNAMKWDTIEATRNVFSYSHGDYILDWAHNHTQAVRAHVFVWHSQLPSWLTSGTWDNSTLISILQNHIANVGGHYAGKVYSWDVVNEIFNEDGTWRSTLWYNTIGSAFVPIAFNAARAADSKAKLYMNDYNVEGTGSKSDAYYALAQTLLAQGVPVHGMGSQAHLIVGSLPGNLASNIARFVALGLEWAYTELDIRMTLPATDALLATQASNYASIVTACVGNSACVGITVWDTSDDYSWVPSTFSGQGAALLFDANKQPKPAYKAVADVLAAATVSGNFQGWYTSGSTTTTTTTTTTATPTSTTVSTTTTATATATPIPLRGLNTLAKAKGRYFGTALDGLWSNSDTVYQALSGNFSEFGMVTPGNAMKWDTIEATRNVFSYSHGDYILDWAHNHTQTVRGHVFVWHSQLPSWLTSGTWDNSTLISILQNHIANVGGHYAGKLYAWDVVNEIFNEDGTWRSTLWYNTIGSAFVPIAFNAAHAIDSKAKLYMNDYNVEGTGSKSDAYYALAQTLLAQGVPVHGMGSQAHLIVGSLPGNLASNIARFVALGLEWAYTELDIRMTLPATDALLATQASNYASIATACVGNSACVGITVWDTSDDYSWVPSTFSGQGAALLFDANKQPKPAYKAVADVLAAATVSGSFTGWYTPGSSSTTTTTTTTATPTSTSVSTTTTATATATPIPLRGLNTLAKAKGRYFGTSLDGLWSNTDTAYQALSGNFSEFGMVTPGNAMKWDTIEATRNVFSYSHGDYILDWAHNHTQTVRGHVFVWHSQLPSWLTSGTWDNSTLISILQNHIANVGGHYAGKLYAWDVVNEIFNEDGTWRSTLWYNTIGSAFVPIAFNAAHAADSKAKLYMNDYNVEGTGSKSDAYYALAQTLLAQGVPVHGMGSQAHLIVGSLPGNLASNIARFVALGLEWAYTELDIRMTLPATDALLATQASNYASIATACVGNSACVGITVWDTSDDYSWVPSTFSGQGAALLFDANKQPKPAYKAVADVLAAATVSGSFTGWYTP
ncbi:hypothetical protein FRB90_009432 [Tulasnella sp. 427]|nr:hypothetical protein FRB90_009432 [Tulasnella sp. 427]